MDVLSIVKSLLVDTPEVIDLWNKIAPVLKVKWFVSADQLAEIEKLVPITQAAVMRKQVIKT